MEQSPTGFDPLPNFQAMPEDLRNRMFKRWIDQRSAYEDMQQQKLRRQSGLVERLVRKTQDLAFGPDDTEAEGAEDMSRIGDEYNYTVTYPQPAVASSAGTLSKLVASAALMAAGGGLVALAPYAYETMKRQPPVVERPHIDTDTHFGIGIYRPDE